MSNANAPLISTHCLGCSLELPLDTSQTFLKAWQQKAANVEFWSKFGPFNIWSYMHIWKTTCSCYLCTAHWGSQMRFQTNMERTTLVLKPARIRITGSKTSKTSASALECNTCWRRWLLDFPTLVPQSLTIEAAVCPTPVNGQFNWVNRACFHCIKLEWYLCVVSPTTFYFLNFYPQSKPVVQKNPWSVLLVHCVTDSTGAQVPPPR